MTPYFCNFNKLFSNFTTCAYCNTVTVSLMDIMIISIIVHVIITLNDMS